MKDRWGSGSRRTITLHPWAADLVSNSSHQVLATSGIFPNILYRISFWHDILNGKTLYSKKQLRQKDLREIRWETGLNFPDTQNSPNSRHCFVRNDCLSKKSVSETNGHKRFGAQTEKILRILIKVCLNDSWYVICLFVCLFICLNESRNSAMSGDTWSCLLPA